MLKPQKLIPPLMALILVASLLAPAALPAGTRTAAMHPALAELAAESPDQPVRVIVMKADGSQRAESLVASLGGTIYRELHIINAFAAELPAKVVKKLSTSEAVNWVSLDAPTQSMSINTEHELFYLHNDPTPATEDTASHAVLSMDGTMPVATTLYNYDIDRDADPGLLIKRGGSGPDELDPAKIQRWRMVPFTEDFTLDASVELKFYAVMEDFQAGLYGKVNGYLIDRDGGQYTVLATDSFEKYDYFVDWERRPIRFTEVVHTFPAGHQLEVVLTVDGTSDDDMWFAYDTVNQAAHLKFTKASDWPQYFLDTIGAPAVWDQGYEGQTVTVAVVDSGSYRGNKSLKEYAENGGLTRIDANVNLDPNFSNAVDKYGHGLYIHSIIGGNGHRSDGLYKGVAPRVRFVNIRVNDDWGMASESQVVEGLQWILDHQAQYNIRVVNLSLNSSIPGSYHTSPLDLAVEILWFNGIAVVVAAGNNGSSDPGIIYPPANDPYAIVVGATDDMASANPTDDTLASFSAYGFTPEGVARPDLAAPGTYIVADSKTSFNFYQEYQDKVVMAVDAGGTTRYHFVASGTSASAAVVSGAVALLLDAQPNLTPDQIKWLLTHTATPLPGQEGVGAGLLNAENLVNTALSYGDPATIPSANQGTMPHMTLAKMALMAYWASVNGGETIDWNLVNWNSVNWNSVNWNTVNWNSVNWNSVNWNSVNWDGIDWSSVNWNSVNWNTVNWNSVNWNSVNWNSVNWNSVNWNSVDLDY